MQALRSLKDCIALCKVLETNGWVNMLGELPGGEVPRGLMALLQGFLQPLACIKTFWEGMRLSDHNNKKLIWYLRLHKRYLWLSRRHNRTLLLAN